MPTSQRLLLTELAGALADLIEGSADARRWYNSRNAPVPRATLKRLVESGDVPGYRVGKILYVERAVLDEYIKAHKVEPHVATDGKPDEAAAVTSLMKRLGATQKKKAS